MSHTPELLADRFLEGDHDGALAQLAGAGPDAARETAALIGDGLRRDAAEHQFEWRERTWVDHQRALLALAELPGVDPAELAAALVDTCCLQQLNGEGSPLDPDVFDWLMRWAPGRVYDAVDVSMDDDDLPVNGYRFLEHGLWTYPDPQARAWMLDRFRANPVLGRWAYRDMRLGKRRAVWSDAEWNLRVHLLCDAALEEPPIEIDPDLPAATSAAQVRLACTYAGSDTDHLLRVVAENLRRYRIGDPAADVGLVWWEAEGDGAERLRALLEAGGPAGARSRLVDAAAAAGVIDAQMAALLSADMPRPPWMDGDVPWEVDEIVDAGLVHLPDGRLSAVDPYVAFEGVPFVVDVPPGHHPVRITFAVHPLLGRACAVAELVLAEGAGPTRWERLGAGVEAEFGYQVEVGVGSFGATGALTDPSFHDLAPEDFHANAPSHARVDAGDLGSIVMFHVTPQHQVCRTWAARAADGTITRVLSDLGILDVDPETRPDAPVRPSPPPAGPTARRKPTPYERERGIAHGDRYRPREGAADEVVKVLHIMDPVHGCWPKVESVWYRWESSRVGDHLPLDEFRERFVPLG